MYLMDHPKGVLDEWAPFRSIQKIIILKKYPKGRWVDQDEKSGVEGLAWSLI